MIPHPGVKRRARIHRHTAWGCINVNSGTFGTRRRQHQYHPVTGHVDGTRRTNGQGRDRVEPNRNGCHLIVQKQVRIDIQVTLHVKIETATQTGPACAGLTT